MNEFREFLEKCTDSELVWLYLFARTRGAKMAVKMEMERRVVVLEDR